MRALRPTLLLAASLVASSTACKPNLGSPPSIVSGPRILAVRGSPPEAAESASVTYDVLAVDEMGRIAMPSTTWAVCHDPRSPADANAVTGACLTIPDDTAAMPTFTSPMPDMACKQFGPEPPVTMPGQPPLRPQDPDVTGGFYQPVRVTLTADGSKEVAFALERITCKLTNAPTDIANTFDQTDKPNTNPVIASFTAASGASGTPATLYAASQTAAPTPLTVTASAPLTFEVAWPAATPESYPVWNIVTQMLETHREALSVSWFATDGSFQHDRTGRAETETELTTDDVWTAPVTPGLVHLWVLLRDSRGGVDFAEASVMVTP